MSSSSPQSAGYRIFDESTPTGNSKPPWNPLALFIITILFAPLGAPLFALNWPRLGRPEKRLLWLATAILVALSPFVIALVVQVFPLDLSRETLRIFGRAPTFIFAYVGLLAQRPLFEAAQTRGEQKAATWPFWLALLALIGLFFGVETLRR